MPTLDPPAPPSRPVPLRDRPALWMGLSLAWAAVIFLFSTGLFSAEHSARALGWLLAVLGVRLAPGRFEILHFLLRKAAHLAEYAVLAVLLHGWVRAGRWRHRSAGGAFLVVVAAAAYALTDEFHQVFVPGRTASLYDCALDTLGAGAGLAAWFLLRALLRSRKATPAV